MCLAKEMQRVMAAEAEATRDARAKVVSDDEKLYFFNWGQGQYGFTLLCFSHFHEAGAKSVEVA